MADECGFCGTRRPVAGTKKMMLGSLWVEFCSACPSELVFNGNGEGFRVGELHTELKGGEKAPVRVRRPMRAAQCTAAAETCSNCISCRW